MLSQQDHELPSAGRNGAGEVCFAPADGPIGLPWHVDPVKTDAVGCLSANCGRRADAPFIPAVQQRNSGIRLQEPVWPERFEPYHFESTWLRWSSVQWRCSVESRPSTAAITP